MDQVRERGYVLHGPRTYRSASAILPALVGVGGIAASTGAERWLGFGGMLGWPAVAFLLFGVGSGVYRAIRRPELLRVDGEGVRFGGVAVPWPSVWQLVLLRPEPVVGAFRTDLPPQVGVRLKRGAPLPAGMNSLVTDPDDPLAIPDPLRSQVGGVEIDGEAVLAAAAACAPPDVVLVERLGDQERVLTR